MHRRYFFTLTCAKACAGASTSSTSLRRSHASTWPNLCSSLKSTFDALRCRGCAAPRLWGRGGTGNKRWCGLRPHHLLLRQIFYTHCSCSATSHPGGIEDDRICGEHHCSFSAPAAFPDFPGAGPEPEMLTCPVKSLIQTVHFQLRLLSLICREPDPSQKCLHFLSILSLKLLIFSSGCLPSLSGSRTRARNAYMSF